MNRQQKFQEHQTIGQTLVLALKISKYFHRIAYDNSQVCHTLFKRALFKTSSTSTQNIIAILAHFFTIFYSNCCNCTLNEISPMTLKLKQPSYLSFTFYCYYNPNNNNILFSKMSSLTSFYFRKRNIFRSGFGTPNSTETNSGKHCLLSKKRLQIGIPYELVSGEKQCLEILAKLANSSGGN